MTKCEARLIIITIFCCLLTVGSIFIQEIQLKPKPTLENARLVGTYQVDDQQVSRPIPESGTLNLTGYHTVTFKGAFDQVIPINQQVMLRADNIRIRVLVNETLIFEHGYTNLPTNVRSPGNVWVSFPAPQLTLDDEITMIVENVYVDHVNTTYEHLLNNIYIGYESDLTKMIIGQNVFNLVLSIIIFCTGVFTLVITLFLHKVMKNDLRFFFFAGLCISFSIWSSSVDSLFPYPIVINSLDIISLLLTMFFLLGYVRSFVASNVNWWMITIFQGVMLFTVFGLNIVQLFGIADFFDALPYIQMFGFIGPPLTVVGLIVEKVKGDNPLSAELFPSALILASGLIADIIGNYFEIMPTVVWFRMSFVVFIIIQFVMLTRFVHTLFINQGRIKALETIAYHDDLTGIGNRRAYMQRKVQLTDSQLYLISIFDLNNLKVVNDTFGHKAGDLLIKQSAEFLLTLFEPHELYRIGGDEFVAIQTFPSKQVMQAFIDMFETNIAQQQNMCLQTEIYFSIAYGYAAASPMTGQCFETVFAQADQNMYAMKQQMKADFKV
ncbi:MAG: GGDEF domain-containing protein [Culicoidibacterales bacterium]